MSKIKKFTVKNATITIDSATTLQFNHNKCYQIDAPFIFAVAYKCNEYILLHELQGFTTDKIVKPQTADEFQEGLHAKDNPFYLDVYDQIFNHVTIGEDNRLIALHESPQGELSEEIIGGIELNYFHLFKVDEYSWTEVDLGIRNLHDNGLIEWIYFANGMISEIKIEKKEEILKALQDFTCVRQLSTLNIEVPCGLFYYAEGLENGNEHQLEDKKITINFIGQDERDNYLLCITIKESHDTSSILNVLPNKYPIDKNIHLELPYQKARKLLLDILIAGAPYSVNLITK
jgi:hypothetical protein